MELIDDLVTNRDIILISSHQNTNDLRIRKYECDVDFEKYMFHKESENGISTRKS